MKHIYTPLALMLLIILFSCSKDSDKPSCSITPPSWIQGTWVEPNTGFEKWVFTGSNAVHTAMGVVFDQCLLNSGAATIVESTETASTYSLKTTSGGPNPIQTFASFEKVSSIDIRYCTETLPCGSFPFGGVLLVKQ